MSFFTWIDNGRTCEDLNDRLRRAEDAKSFQGEFMGYFDCLDSLPSHRYFIRPWSRLSNFVRNIPWSLRRTFIHPVQRMRRGYDETFVWNLDLNLACLMAKTIAELKETSHTFQNVSDDGERCTWDQINKERDGCTNPTNWERLLNEMVEGFALQCRDEADYLDAPDEVIAMERKIQRAWDLLAQWHIGLWD